MAEQKVIKKYPHTNYEYGILWVYATTIPRAQNELDENVKKRKEKGWESVGEVSQLKREGIYSKNSEMWYLVQPMTRA